MPANGRHTGPPRPRAGQPCTGRSGTAGLGEDHGEQAPQDPGGLRRLSRSDPPTANTAAHVVVTGEPDTRKRVRPVRREAARKRNQPGGLTPRRAADPAQTLRRELLDDAGVFEDLATAQAAVDGFLHEYNTDRPHQALDM